MEIAKAKEAVIEAGKKLVEKGLIARTWGNVSCRINDHKFAITPSGKTYENLNKREIVIVKIEDCSYEGNVEPSSEKKVHAAVYQKRPDINFVIHTHQPYASAVSPLGTDITVSDPYAAGLIGEKVISIPYAPSGTDELKNNVADALTCAREKTYLMVSHGALCLGQNNEEAFKVAALLEKICAEYINKRYLELSGEVTFNSQALRNYFVKKQTGNSTCVFNSFPEKLYNSERIEKGFRLHLETSETDPFPFNSNQQVNILFDEILSDQIDSKLTNAANIHSELYKNYSEIQAVIHTLAPDIVAVSCTGRRVYPMLDDFAQIIGENVQLVDLSNISFKSDRNIDLASQIKGRGAIMFKENGALCCGSSKSDAAAAVTIMDKNCKATIASILFSKGKPINPGEARKMHENYLKHYAKKAIN
ncbi:MAG: class II aldolase/adducin family protein [Bacillota bacterium]